MILIANYLATIVFVNVGKWMHTPFKYWAIFFSNKVEVLDWGNRTRIKRVLSLGCVRILTVRGGGHIYNDMLKRLISLILCGLIITSPMGFAKESESQPSVSPWLYKQLSKTEKLIASQSYTEARQKLQNMLEDVEKGSYGEATVLRSLSSVYALQEQYAKAASTLSRCLALGVLPASQEQHAMLNLGQLYMAMEQYQKAVKVLEPWLANNPKPDTQIYILMANAYAQLKQYRKGLPYIKKAIQSSKKPVESWYQLNLAMYYELEDYASAARLLQKMMHYFPEKNEYWNQAASVYQQSKQYKKAATIKHLAYKKGILESEKDLLAMINLFIYVDAPYKAGSILKKELNRGRIKNNSKNWEMLANSWTQAREFDRAVNALETASKLHEKGTLYQQLGRIYVEQEKWNKAIGALTKALDKGRLEHAGNTYILLGMSYYELKQTDKARRAFMKASNYAKTRKSADQWLNYIKNDTNTTDS